MVWLGQKDKRAIRSVPSAAVEIMWARRSNITFDSAEKATRMRVLKYIEGCTGTNHNGPAWIAYVQTSKSGRTIYFNGRALQHSGKGGGVGNHYDLETREPYWVSGVKKRGSNRHWSGSGHILVEESAVSELLALTGETSLDKSRYRVVPDLPQTDPQQFNELLNEKP